MIEREIMLTSILNCERIDLYLDPKDLSEEEKSRFEAMRERRLSGEPLQYIIGACDFMGIELKADARALIPRPETEILADELIRMAHLKQERSPEHLRILDLGTGSGNLAIAAAKNIHNCSLVALDISRDALTLAQHNAEKNNVCEKIQFVCEDLVEYLYYSSPQKKFHSIVSNPPYIVTSDLAHLPKDVLHEPRIALDGGMDGLVFLRAIISCAYRWLYPLGNLLLEIGDHQAQAVLDLFKTYPYYQNIRFLEDYTKTKRIVVVERGMHG